MEIIYIETIYFCYHWDQLMHKIYESRQYSRITFSSFIYVYFRLCFVKISLLLSLSARTYSDNDKQLIIHT